MRNSKSTGVWGATENAAGERVLSSTWRDASADWWLSAAMELPRAAEQAWGADELEPRTGEWDDASRGEWAWNRELRPAVWADERGVHVTVGLPSAMARWGESARTAYWMWAWSEVHGELRELARS